MNKPIMIGNAPTVGAQFAVKRERDIAHAQLGLTDIKQIAQEFIRWVQSQREDATFENLRAWLEINFPAFTNQAKQIFNIASVSFSAKK